MSMGDATRRAVPANVRSTIWYRLGSVGSVMSAIQSEYFGRKSQGIIRGWLSVVRFLLTVAAPVVAGR